MCAYVCACVCAYVCVRVCACVCVCVCFHHEEATPGRRGDVDEKSLCMCMCVCLFVCVFLPCVRAPSTLVAFAHCEYTDGRPKAHRPRARTRRHSSRSLQGVHMGHDVCVGIDSVGPEVSTEQAEPFMPACVSYKVQMLV